MLSQAWVPAKNALKDCKNGRTNWVSKVKKLLCNYGFAYVFDNVES